jgi:hypothetical protein
MHMPWQVSQPQVRTSEIVSLEKSCRYHEVLRADCARERQDVWLHRLMYEFEVRKQKLSEQFAEAVETIHWHMTIVSIILEVIVTISKIRTDRDKGYYGPWYEEMNFQCLDREI